MRSAALILLLGSACAVVLVAAQPSWAWPQSRGSTTSYSTAPLIVHTIGNFSSGATPTRPDACGLTAGCALGRVVPLSAAAWTDSHVMHPTLAAVAVAPWAALPAGAPEVGAAQTWLKLAADRIGDLAKQALAAGAAWVLARHVQASHACAAASAAVNDATAAALMYTCAPLQRGLAAAATAVNRARALLPAKTRQLVGAAATALGHAWPDPKVYPLHATAKLLVRATATAGDAAAWARPAAQCRERALLAALRGRRQAVRAAGGLPPPAGLLCSGMAHRVPLLCASDVQPKHAVCYEALRMKVTGSDWAARSAGAVGRSAHAASARLAAAATTVNTARALVATTTRQLAGAAATALGHAWPDPKVYPLHATAELLVSAAATAGDAAAWARPAAQAAADQCRERALLAALRGRRQAMRAAGGLPPPAGLLRSSMARRVLLLAVHGTVSAVASRCLQCCCLCVLLLLQTKHAV